jgi:hypothetical protein
VLNVKTVPPLAAKIGPLLGVEPFVRLYSQNPTTELPEDDNFDESNVNPEGKEKEAVDPDAVPIKNVDLIFKESPTLLY